jgi:hypothetical protein
LCGFVCFGEFARYQLNSYLQSNTLELDDKAQTLSYEHYYPYGGTAIIAGKDKTQVQQKRYRSVNTIHKAIPRDKRKMPCWISIFKRIIPHINIQIQTINRTR